MLRFSTVLFFCVMAWGAPDRVRIPVDASRTSVLRGHVHRDLRTADDRGPVSPSLVLSYVSVLLKPDATLEGFLMEQQTPGTASFRKWLSPAQFGSRFGASAHDLAAVRNWLQSENLLIHDVAKGGLWITFSGSADRIQRALHTDLHRFQWQGAMRHAPVTEPSVPEALAPVIAAFSGLDDFGEEPALRTAKALTDLPDYNSGSSHYLAPDDIATIYGSTDLYNSGVDGTGQKIAVIGQTAINLQDIRSFRTRFNLPAKDPELVLVGTDPGTRSTDEPEADLDVEWSGAVARNATVVYVYSTSVRTSAQYAVDRNLAPVMTYSYGACEPQSSTAFRAVAQQANAQGITWMVSSGDSGAATCDRNTPVPQATKGNTVSYPSTFPEVTAVGGTQFDEGSGQYWASANGPNGNSALSYIPERAWNNSISRNQLSSAGGGASAYFPKPFWQTGPGVPNDNARDVPDVSFSASPDHDGYLVINGGTLKVFGGTSVSTPVFAGMTALLNQYLTARGQGGGLGNMNPVLYRMAQSTSDVFHDVVNGDNKVPCAQSSPDCVDGFAGYDAGLGYDLATGLGSLNVSRLASEWNAGSVSATTLALSPSSGPLSESVQLLAQVKGQGAIPTGSVTFLSNGVMLGTVKLDPNGFAMLTVGSALLAAGDGSVTALYSGDGLFAGSGTASSFTPVLSGAAVVASVSPNPVYQVGTTWPYTVTIRNQGNSAATITEFTVGGVNNLAVLSSTRIGPNSSLSVSLGGSGLTVPVNRVFHFAGTDASGATFSEDFSVPFLGPLTSFGPALSLTAAPATVQRNASAPADCQWRHLLTVTESGGFYTQLTRLVAGSTDLTSNLPTLFGTTRLAPFGKLQAVVCLGGSTVPASRNYQLTGTAETSGSVTASATVTFAAASANPADFSVSKSGVAFSGSQSDTVQLQFGGGSPSWMASVVGSKATTGWLSVQPSSGSGSSGLTIQVSDSGLSRGAYAAVVRIQAQDALPQVIEIPVTLTVGGSGGVTVAGVTNAASFGTTLAPGAIMSVFGSQLSLGTQSAPRIPLPLTLGGATATVNGVTAPLYFSSTGQLNVQVPYETGAGTAVLGINYNGQTAAFPFSVAVTAPGIFADGNRALVPSNTGSAGQVLLAFITGEGDVTPSLATGATPASTTTVAQLPKPRQSLSLTVGGVPAEVAFAGIPSGLAGVTQINFTVPAGLASGPQPVVVTVGGVASEPVTLTVK